MELTCDIMKRAYTKKKIKRNYSDDTEDPHVQFKKLHLSLINNLNDFLDCMKKEKYILVTRELLQQYFQNVEHVMISAILMSYCISQFSDKIFDSYKTRFEQKLIFAANKTMVTFNKLIGGDSPSNFYNIVDNYISLYKIWKSQDSIDVLTKLFEELQTEIKIIKIQKKKNMNINLERSRGMINGLFEQNPKYVVRIILHNYDIFNGLESITEYFWDLVKKSYDNEEYSDIIFITLISELKIKLIPKLSDPYDRKKVYYNIDTEDIIQRISNEGLTTDVICGIIDIFGNKMKKVNSQFVFDGCNDDVKVVDSFKAFYNELL